ncbi:MAG: DUF1330 domain-containing protein [bacterium]|nr:DUF1330 domain-containing protein [bacterium]
MPAYMIFTRDSTSDQSEMDIYAKMAGASLAGHPITPRAFYGAFEVLEGDPIEGAVLLEFPTMADARAWYDSPAYQAAVAHRHAGSRYRVVIVDGVG